MNASACVTVYCPLCQMDVQADSALPAESMLHCPACGQEFLYSVPLESLSAPAVSSRPVVSPPGPDAPVGAASISCNVPEKWATSMAPIPAATKVEKPKVAKFTRVAQRNAAKVHFFGYAGCALAVLTPIALGIYFYPTLKAQFWPDATQAVSPTPDDSAAADSPEAPASGAFSFAAPQPKTQSASGARRPSPGDSALQASKRKVAEGKIRSATSFLHDGGRSAFDNAIKEMNTAQSNYDGTLHNAPARGKGNALDRAQVAIDIAFCHGLEAYDYLIQKKIAQLTAANEMDTTGITQSELNKIRDQLDEARWLSKKGAVMWWIGRGMRPVSVRYWRNPSITANKDGLVAQDRSDEILPLQKLADENF